MIFDCLNFPQINQQEGVVTVEFAVHLVLKLVKIVIEVLQHGI